MGGAGCGDPPPPTPIASAIWLASDVVRAWANGHDRHAWPRHAGRVAADRRPEEGSSESHDAAGLVPRAELMTGMSRRVRDGVLAVSAGACIALTLPPLGWWPFGPVGAAVLAAAVRDQPWLGRLRVGAAAGLALFVPGLAWMAPFSLAGFSLAVVVEAGFLAAAMVAVPPGRGRLLALPAALVLAEAARDRWPLGGLPLAGPALGQAAGPLAAAASLGGALAVVALMAAMGSALAGLATVATARRPRRTASAAMATLAAASVVAALASIAPAGRAAGTLVVAAVQGGGPRGLPATQADPAEVLNRHLTASQDVRPPLGLVLWPEDVVDVPGPVARSRAGAVLSDLASRLGATVIAGVVEDVGGDRFRNAAVAWDGRGRIVARYEKVRRVPFGEYVPARPLVARVADLSRVPRDAVPGRGPGLLATPAGRLGVLISYEVFFADRALAAVRGGAAVLLVPTNAASYATGQIPAMQVAAARLRALESGRAVVQAAPTGYSILVDPSGRITAASELGQPAVLQARVGLRSGVTPYARTGDAPAAATALLALALAWGRARSSVRSRAGRAWRRVGDTGGPVGFRGRGRRCRPWAGWPIRRRVGSVGERLAGAALGLLAAPPSAVNPNDGDAADPQGQEYRRW